MILYLFVLGLHREVRAIVDVVWSILCEMLAGCIVAMLIAVASSLMASKFRSGNLKLNLLCIHRTLTN